MAVAPAGLVAHDARGNGRDHTIIGFAMRRRSPADHQDRATVPRLLPSERRVDSLRWDRIDSFCRMIAALGRVLI
jgi:hypothetical protein